MGGEDFGRRRIHERFETTGGEGAVRGLNLVSRFPHDAQPWTDIWLAAAVERQTRDDWWDPHDLTPLLKDIDIPGYLGSEWPNVPLHLGGALDAWRDRNRTRTCGCRSSASTTPPTACT